MSSTIRKVLGYALTDVTSNDSRINWQSALVDSTYAAPSFDDFAAHLEAKDAQDWSRFNVHGIRQHGRTRPDLALDRCVVHSFWEDGLPEVMVIVPPSEAAEWIQQDNIFDYTHAHLSDEPSVEPTLQFPRGIYPYDGDWMDKDTGELLDPNGVLMFRRLVEGNADPELLVHGARKIRVFRPWDDDFVAPAEPLFKDAGVALDRLVRLVPAEVRELTVFGGLLTDPDTWKSLRPVHYTYWT